MLARSVLRACGPVRQSIRGYASEAQAPKSSSTPYIVGAAAIGTGILGYSFLGSSSKTSKTDGAPSQSTEDQKNINQQKEEAPGKTFTGGEQGFVDLKLKEIIPYNHNTKRFKFALPDEEHVSGLNVACGRVIDRGRLKAAIITKFKPEDAEKPVIRPYTPINDEGKVPSHPLDFVPLQSLQPTYTLADARGYLELLVKVYPKGPMSEHIHGLKEGDTLSFKGPIPKYPWSPNKHSHITLISGGTGITPMYQLIRAIAKNPEDKTKVSLIFGNIKEEDILLKKELSDLEKEFPQRFRVFYTLDNPPESWPYGKGFITKELLKEVIPDPKTENIKIFVCGPPGLYKAVSGPKVSPQDQGELSGILKELGYTKEQVFKF
ncbi:NADH-cytochrome b5 reductase 2 [Cladophialophora carrionii]|uniref:NADH-cytochrome b5 reductase n=1 Tax=Cladophialophora carrionii TaxID=86049 RepID=A0A1C1CGV3_9EURO|nr:NADH-cytochrome b5 reductase 2 [Cladophialophora carrionii]